MSSKREALTDDNPQLPEHDEGTANSMRRHLGRVDGHGSIFCANANSHDKAGSEKTFPALRDSRADGGSGKTQCSDEDLASSSKPVV